MFRPVRSLLLMLVLLFAGMMAERYQQSERCAAAGGEMRDGLCRGV